MRIIGDTNIPFLSYRKIALSISMVIIVAGLAYQLLGPGLNLGIDFVGGTQVTIKFRSEPDLGQLRATMSDLDVGRPLLQRFDEAEKYEDVALVVCRIFRLCEAFDINVASEAALSFMVVTANTVWASKLMLLPRSI